MSALIEHPSPNCDARPDGAPIDMLVFHYTGMPSAEAALARMCDPASEVSAHYMVTEDGTVYRLVDEDKRAWHAGVASWRGLTDINARSIGIELVNPGHEFGYHAFPGLQMTAAAELARKILTRIDIPARNVVGHSDIAPRRKQDPGELFPWEPLALQGIGLWPHSWEPSGASEPRLRSLFEEFGYETTDLVATVTAFQRRFRADKVDGRADAETVGRLRGLLALVS